MEKIGLAHTRSHSFSEQEEGVGRREHTLGTCWSCKSDAARPGDGAILTLLLGRRKERRRVCRDWHIWVKRLLSTELLAAVRTASSATDRTFYLVFRSGFMPNVPGGHTMQPLFPRVTTYSFGKSSSLCFGHTHLYSFLHYLDCSIILKGS